MKFSNDKKFIPHFKGHKDFFIMYLQKRNIILKIHFEEQHRGRPFINYESKKNNLKNFKNV